MNKLYGIILASTLTTGCITEPDVNCTLTGGEVRTIGADVLKRECEVNRELTFKCIIPDGDETQIVNLACGAMTPEDFLHFAETDLICSGSTNPNEVTATCGQPVAQPLPR